MHRIDTSTKQANKFGTGKDGFTSGDPIAGVAPTRLTAEWHDAVQEEVAGIVESAAITLDKNNQGQLLAALKTLFADLVGYAHVLTRQWFVQTIPGSGYTDIAWSPTLKILVAVGSNVIATSFDGITWTARTTPGTNQWQAIVWADALNLFVAVSNTGTNRVMTSADGINWTLHASANDSAQWFGIAWSGSKLVAIGDDGATGIVATSANATSWALAGATLNQPNGSGITRNCLNYANGLFLAAFGTSRYKSADGLTWTLSVGGASGRSAPVWAPSLGLYLVPRGGAVDTSPDFVTWTGKATANSQLCNCIAWSNDLNAGALFFEAGSQVNVTFDGVNFRARSEPENNTWNAGIWVKELGAFVAIARGNGGGAGTHFAMMSL